MYAIYGGFGGSIVGKYGIHGVSGIGKSGSEPGRPRFHNGLRSCRALLHRSGAQVDVTAVVIGQLLAQSKTNSCISSCRKPEATRGSWPYY